MCITGEWEATKLTINGMDKLYIIDSLNKGKYRFTFSNEKDEDDLKYVGDYVAIDKQGNEIRPIRAYSLCGFYDNLEKLNFTPLFSANLTPEPLVFFPNYYLFTHLGSEDWKIIKLTKKEMKSQSLEYDIAIEMKKV